MEWVQHQVEIEGGTHTVLTACADSSHLCLHSTPYKIMDLHYIYGYRSMAKIAAEWSGGGDYTPKTLVLSTALGHLRTIKLCQKQYTHYIHRYIFICMKARRRMKQNGREFNISFYRTIYAVWRQDKRKSQLGVQHTVQSSVAKTFGDFSCKEFYNKIHCTVFSGQWVLTCQTLALTVKWPTEPVDTDVTGRQGFSRRCQYHYRHKKFDTSKCFL